MKNTEILPSVDYQPITEKNFAKTYKKHANHEIWHTCSNCGKEFDLRTNQHQCPKCNQVIK